MDKIPRVAEVRHAVMSALAIVLRIRLLDREVPLAGGVLSAVVVVKATNLATHRANKALCANKALHAVMIAPASALVTCRRSKEVPRVDQVLHAVTIAMVIGLVTRLHASKVFRGGEVPHAAGVLRVVTIALGNVSEEVELDLMIVRVTYRHNVAIRGVQEAEVTHRHVTRHLVSQPRVMLILAGEMIQHAAEVDRAGMALDVMTKEAVRNVHETRNRAAGVSHAVVGQVVAMLIGHVTCPPTLWPTLTTLTNYCGLGSRCQMAPLRRFHSVEVRCVLY